ncbi:MAG: thioredoxin family protein [Synergistaceae bacterium]|nr:thioredoxin family protein [Synergistaceae bacterium]
MNDLTQDEFDELIYDDEQAAVIFFHKTGCAVCEEVSGKLDGLSRNYNLIFAGVNALEERELFSRFGLRGVPQVLFFKDGRLLKTLAGRHDSREYVNSIELLTLSGIEASQALKKHDDAPELETVSGHGAMI